MSTVINSTLLLKILDKTPSNHNIMLIGKHGIGKSQILEKYFSSRGCKVVTLFLGQMSDPGDIIGLPHKNEETGTTEFLPPFWFPSDNKPIVLFLDELNRSRPEVLQSVMDLTLNRKLAGRPLPEGSRIISAVNNGDEYQLTELDPALVSRFNIYEFVPSVNDWIVWAKENGIDSRIINFIQWNPYSLDNANEKKYSDDCMEKSPDRRGWERVSSILCEEEEPDNDIKSIIAGIIGKETANLFFDFMDKNRILTAKEILLNDFEKTKIIFQKYGTPEFAAINDSLFEYLEKIQPGSKTKAQVAENFIAYWNYICENDLQEVKAHFANCIAGTAYPDALVFIVMECAEVFESVTSFVTNLR